MVDDPNCPPPPMREQDRALARSDVQPLVRRGSVGWLIEHHNHFAGHRWLRCMTWDEFSAHPRANLGWTEDARDALRFAREQDAKAFAYLHPEFCTLAKVTEHLFDC